MQRQALADLEAWSRRPRRKPLVIRGARQVGKTTLVRLFAERAFESLCEINFERTPDIADLFVSKDPRKVIELLELRLGQDIVAGRSLVFLDEIQAAPEVLAALRYFYEEMPELHVVAAGSLLELALDKPNFSVPVGRIEYLHLGPMQLSEMLEAAGQERLARYLAGYRLGDEIPISVHRQLLVWLRRFLIIGGMPEAVRAYVESEGLRDSEAAKHSILATFRDDFGKYGPRVDTARLRKVFERLPLLIGEKLKYVHIDRQERSKVLAEALHLLALARVAFRVRHTSANGIPLGAEADERKLKLLHLDVGLVATASGLTLLDLEGPDHLLLVQRGKLAEQFVGQHLLYSTPSWEEPQLFYWMREKRNASAEIDYVISQGRQVVPIEVKAGKTGTLKSLHVFLREKGRPLGVRLNSAPPAWVAAETSLPGGANVPFHLLSLPLYLIGELRRLVTEAATDLGRQ